MAQGRGSAGKVMAAGLAVLFLTLLQSELADAASYTVGGNGGWTFNVEKWPQGKSFRVGDVLVFKYDPAAHNLVQVDAVSYKGCTTPRGAKVHSSGKDSIKLVKGPNYFICNFPGHCQSGMKVLINAA